jgi:predicted transcriptional regulator
LWSTIEAILAVIGGLVVAGGILALITAFAVELLSTRRSKIESEMYRRQCNRLSDLAASIEDEDESAAYILRALASGLSADSAADRWRRMRHELMQAWTLPERLGEPR